MARVTPQSVLYGLSESFRALLLVVCPQVTMPGYMEIGNYTPRDLDFVEVFSGRGHLTEQLFEASGQKYNF